VEKVDPVDRIVTLRIPEAPEGTPSPPPSFGENNGAHPLLRLWDSPGAVNVEVSDDSDDDGIPLEDGIEVKFFAEDDDSNFRTGDYWLIPARTIPGNIQWPQEVSPSQAKAVPPQGIVHRYAPLARITLDEGGNPDEVVDYRRTFAPLSEPAGGLPAPAGGLPAPDWDSGEIILTHDKSWALIPHNLNSRDLLVDVQIKVSQDNKNSLKDILGDVFDELDLAQEWRAGTALWHPVGEVLFHAMYILPDPNQILLGGVREEISEGEQLIVRALIWKW
jgi:hypothetical protein